MHFLSKTCIAIMFVSSTIHSMDEQSNSLATPTSSLCIRTRDTFVKKTQALEAQRRDRKETHTREKDTNCCTIHVHFTVKEYLEMLDLSEFSSCKPAIEDLKDTLLNCLDNPNQNTFYYLKGEKPSYHGLFSDLKKSLLFKLFCSDIGISENDFSINDYEIHQQSQKSAKLKTCHALRYIMYSPKTSHVDL